MLGFLLVVEMGKLLDLVGSDQVGVLRHHRLGCRGLGLSSLGLCL